LPSEKREKEKRPLIVTDEILAGIKLFVSLDAGIIKRDIKRQPLSAMRIFTCKIL